MNQLLVQALIKANIRMAEAEAEAEREGTLFKFQEYGEEILEWLRQDASIRNAANAGAICTGVQIGLWAHDQLHSSVENGKEN